MSPPPHRTRVRRQSHYAPKSAANQSEPAPPAPPRIGRTSKSPPSAPCEAMHWLSLWKAAVAEGRHQDAEAALARLQALKYRRPPRRKDSRSLDMKTTGQLPCSESGPAKADEAAHAVAASKPM